MVKNIAAQEFVTFSRALPVLDVRSPGEFRQGHIPGAISFPLFDDGERAEVGTLYKQVGQMQAVERGLEIVGGKMRTMFAQGLAHAQDGKLMVHCWRGGKRSESVANLLAVAGLEVYVLIGGYKSYRRWVLDQFALQHRFLVVGGLTGTGKTRILHHLRMQGQAMLDIEGHAAHRGSAFGRLGQTTFVSPQQFENGMATDLAALAGHDIWIEDESRVLGSLTLPQAFWDQKQAAPVFYVEIPDADRIRMLLEDYGTVDHAGVAASIAKISQNLGGLRTQQALEALRADDGETLTRMLLDYYDKLYQNSLKAKPKEHVHHLRFDRFDLEEISSALLAKARELGYDLSAKAPHI
ncbi:MAG TPA: tRNA 2-selenouridine(34) synthase MnmH [Bacteroidia bacterium]|nr:tRNA 2-selenouridine(34) synthase MnmH [Bacteroidia bacterium]